jgi:hypothetical protein
MKILPYREVRKIKLHLLKPYRYKEPRYFKEFVASLSPAHLKLLQKKLARHE